MSQNKIHSHWIVCQLGRTTCCLSPPADGVRDEVSGVMCVAVWELCCEPVDGGLVDREYRRYELPYTAID